MSTVQITESEVEQAALAWFEALGYRVLFGPDIAPGEVAAERTDYSEVVLERRLRDALGALTPDMPAEALEQAFRKVTRPESPSLIANNRAFHNMLVNGVEVEYRSDDRVVGDLVRLVDFDDPEQNDWLVVNQFTVTEGQNTRRPDIVVFVNGLPLAVIELKNPADEEATIWTAFDQLQTYKQQIPSLFAFNEALVVSDGVQARLGTLTGEREWFLPWRTTEGEEVAPPQVPQLQVLLQGVFEKRRFLDLLRCFIVFEADGANIAKKVAGYHQFHAVRKALEATVKASRPQGDKRCGVVWHTQGSGKSLTMAFYAGALIRHPAMENPTIVVITDRNDLDDQLFGTFCRCADLLRQTPEQAEDRADLRRRLQRAAGGVIFTTIQKFAPDEGLDTFPLLSDRRNVVVIADEAHRSQYGLDAQVDSGSGEISYGFAKYVRDALPNASFIGFTGTPIETADRSTPAIFGDYISIYDIQQAVEDGATVPIFYEARLAKIALDESERPRIDPDFEEVTEGEEISERERLKRKWAQLEAMVGTEKRVSLIAQDIVDHFEGRLEAMDGKALIVCMSRRICVDLHNAIVKLRPDWHHDDDDKGALKVVMTGSASDRLEWQPHIRNKPRRAALADRFRNADDPLKLVIVRDMWLTGFDVPCLHTMYVDKPMRGHTLMQAIARVNRVFRDKPGGLVVDYIGIAYHLKEALADYTQGGGRGKGVVDQDEAVATMLAEYEVCCAIFHGFDYSRFLTGSPTERLSILPAAQEHVLGQEDGKDRFLLAVHRLSLAFALAMPREEAIGIRPEVGFFQAVRAGLVKTSEGPIRTQEEIEHAVRQIVSRAVVSEGVIDIYSAAGLKRPDISILSDEFLAEVREMPQRNLAVEVLRKLLNDEIKVLSRKNLIQSRSFAEMLEKAIRAYQNRTIEAAQVVQELIEIAKQMREAHGRGERLGLSDDEVAFYDALGVNDSAVQVLGDETLQQIAVELTNQIRRSVTIDWTVKESVRADIRRRVKRILRKHGYPPDRQERATQNVLEQAELLCADWAQTDMR